jgi:cytochrome P450
MTITSDMRRVMHGHRPTMDSIPGIDRLADLTIKPHWRSGPLAVPPPGSGLEPIIGDAGVPGIGMTLGLLRDAQGYAEDVIAEHGPVTWSKSLGVKMVLACGGDAAQVVLANKDKAFSQSGWDFFIKAFFNRGLMLLDFGEHLRHRRIMQQAFTHDRLVGYLDGMDELISARVPTWPADDPSFLAYPAIKALSLDIATVLFMAGEVGESAEIVTALTDAVHAGSAIVRFPVPYLSWSRGLAGRRMLERYFRAKLPAKRAADGSDLFAALCHARTDDGDAFSDDDIVNHMIFLMMAAHDTSSMTATTVAYYLAKHPEWQTRVRQECLALQDRPLEIDSLAELHTLDLVINESLRLAAPVPALVRRTVIDTDILGHYVPAGTMVAVLPGVNHTMSEYWTDPDVFDPMRFAEPRREDKSHRYAFLPFGGGAHKCIGMHFGTLEVKSLLVRLLTRYELEVPPDYQLRWDKSSLWFPPDGLPMTLRPL